MRRTFITAPKSICLRLTANQIVFAIMMAQYQPDFGEGTAYRFILGYIVATAT